MVQTSGIREKLRSNILKELARERSTKRTRQDEQDEDKEEEEEDGHETKKVMVKPTNSSLLSILPKPKNSSVFGPTVKLDDLLKMPDRAETTVNDVTGPENPAERIAEDGIMEVDVSKVVANPSYTNIKDLTIEKGKPSSVIVPKGKEKQKNQITYLAQLGKAFELERKEQAAQGRANKAAARKKYGW